MTLPLNAWTPLRMVLTVCPRCFEEDPERDLDYEMDVLQGNLVAMDGRVYLRRHCRRGHGEVIGLYEEDGALWEELQQWRIPTRQIIPDRPANTRPIPMGYLDGLGDLQTQHSCIVLIDVTETCNLECPTCFASSAPGVGRHAPEPAVMRTLDAAIAREGGKVDALMLSGGEPTVHPGILDLVRAATERNVTRVVLNTNGIRIARDDAVPGRAGQAARPGRDLPPVRRVPRVHVPLAPRRGPAGDQGRRDPPTHRRAHLHDARGGRGQGRQRGRGRGDRRPGARHRLPRGRRHPADVRVRARERLRPDGPRDDHRHDQAARATDQRPRLGRRLHRAAVQPPRLRDADVHGPPRRRAVPLGRLDDRARPS